ncbi:MAG: ABC transporter substrate-binding protein [Planctomycetes bacterium]|nr:ABC transporter substrate-binding protein [Planctomycetota bacterium]
MPTPSPLACAAAALLLGLTAATQQTADRQDAGSPPEPPIRVMLRARNGGADRLNPLRYIGGFETKTLLFETLVRRGEDGRLAPGLASRWEILDEGRAVRFELRDGARFHDGRPVTADIVRTHFRRWIGLPEHDWLACNQRITDVTVDSEREFTVHLDRPYALLGDLCAINPCAILGPGARDWEGEFQRPVGTGPFRFVAASDDGGRWQLAPTAGDGPLLEITLTARGRDTVPIEALRAGRIDAFVGGWDEDLPAAELDALAADERFVVETAPGSSVAYMSFRLDDGPTADVGVRRRIAAAIDRDRLVAEVEGGRAEPCTAWAAPSVGFWPRGRGRIRPPESAAVDAGAITLRIAAGRADSRTARLARAIAAQLEHAGFVVEVTAQPGARLPQATGADGVGTVRPLDEESGEVRRARGEEIRRRAEAADLRIQITHGVPYDPQRSLAARFGPRAGDNPDSPRPRGGVDPELMQLVAATMSQPDELARGPLYAAIQARLDREALIVPLYAPNRVALRTRDVDGIELGIDVYRVDLTGLHRVSR